MTAHKRRLFIASVFKKRIYEHGEHLMETVMQVLLIMEKLQTASEIEGLPWHVA